MFMWYKKFFSYVFSHIQYKNNTKKDCVQPDINSYENAYVKFKNELFDGFCNIFTQL